MTAKFRKHLEHPIETRNPVASHQAGQHALNVRFVHDDLSYGAVGHQTDEQHDLAERPGTRGQDIQSGPHALQHASTAAQSIDGHNDAPLSSPVMAQYTSSTTGNGNEAPPPGEFDMLPPPPSTHASWQALHDFAQSHAAAHGYALSINTTAKNRSRIKLACVCYGQPKNTHKLTAETRVRKNRVSYKTGCKMWVDGKKQDNGTWVLRIGETQHNHRGRASEDWAVQRKRTWGVVGGRVGVGGVTAMEEASQISPTTKETLETAATAPNDVELRPMALHKLERGGLIWKIVEQEMLRKGEPGQGRDRGVGRTVEVLQARLPGIRIFKRDVYNIRAQIRKVRKAAGQQLGEGLDDSEPDDGGEDEADEGDMDEEPSTIQATKASHYDDQQSQTYPATLQQIDPSLTIPNESRTQRLPTSALTQSEAYELEQLRRENAELRRLLSEKTDEVKKKSIEIASLRTQTDYLTLMSMTDGRAR
ncbi:hypothetical protein NX059_006311 [Plenodomus lindquistii]|nr:hypothetical protein NX059_006311 [Plenodomus lindquistii]